MIALKIKTPLLKLALALVGLSPIKDANVDLISVLKNRSQKIINETKNTEGANIFDIFGMIFFEVNIITTKIEKIIPILGPITSRVLYEFVDRKYEFKKIKHIEINKNTFEYFNLKG